MLNREIGELYDSYYEFDSHDQACWFNEEQEKTDKSLMLELTAPRLQWCYENARSQV